MPRPTIRLLSDENIRSIHDTSLHVLEHVGVLVHHPRVVERLAEAGAMVNRDRSLVRFPGDMVVRAIEAAGKQYVLSGRDGRKVARFGLGDLNLISSPGQFAWFDRKTGQRRDPLLADAREAALVGDALANISIVGGMAVPVDVPQPIRDVVLTAELVKRTVKPTRCWPVSRQSTRYVLEIYKALAGGKEALQRQPMAEVFLEPISPLQLPESGLDILFEFLDCGQPVSVGPMVMASGTGPATLAGTLAQENAEILAGIATIQVLRPGTAVLYGGIPHIMDPRTSICSFGSPEQGLMAVAMAEIAKSYGFPVYINVNLTDSPALDVQAGMEKMGGFVMGILAGADLFGHAGIVGTDHGASLSWLIVDDESMQFARRIARGFDITEETLASSIIAEVGPAGNYLSCEHTLAHFRKELSIPDALWTRDTFEVWGNKGSRSMSERVRGRLEEILDGHEAAPLEEGLAREIDRIVQSARRELVG